MACSFKTFRHAFGLLKNLNNQRLRGNFCDCVIRLHLYPEKLYLAHRNILAASSPVLASLLSNQEALLDLQCPNLTPETLGFLLEFIYTGTLPPPGSEDSVCSAATYLEMEELYQALSYRGSAASESSEDIEAGDITSDVEGQPELPSTERNANVLCLSKGTDWTCVSPQSRESVPVIWHASVTGQDEKQALCSEVYPQYISLCQGQEAECQSAAPLTGTESQYYEQRAPPGHSRVVQESGLVRYFSVITGAKNDRSLEVMTDPPHRLCKPAKEDEKPEQQHTDYYQDTTCSSPESSSEDCIQIHVVKCAIKSTPTDPEPWTHMAQSSAKNHTVSAKNTMLEMPAVKKLDIEEVNDPVKADIIDEEKEQYFVLYQKNELPSYQGKVAYRCVDRARISDSDSEDQDVGEAEAVINDRADSPMNAKTNCHSSSLVNFSSTHVAAGVDGSGGAVKVFDDLAAAAQPYRCVQCERAFSQRGSLNRHLRSHLGVRPYPCPRCPMTFSRQYRVLEHLRVHQRSCEGLGKTDST